MLARLLSLDRVSVISHRGGSKLRPENTFAAFDHACELGVDALECDVHLSRDGEVVVIHDFTLERTTDGQGPLDMFTASQLAHLDAGFHFQPDQGHPYRGRGQGVPRLAELLARYPAMPIVIEVKGARPEVAERTVSVVRQAQAMDRVMIGGFSDPVLKTVRRLEPQMVTGASGIEARGAVLRSYLFLAPNPTGYRLFHMPLRLRGKQALRRSFVRSARRAGIPVHAWVVDDPAEMRRIIDWGVTGIITDRPDVALTVLKASGTGHQATGEA